MNQQNSKNKKFRKIQRWDWQWNEFWMFRTRSKISAMLFALVRFFEWCVTKLTSILQKLRFSEFAKIEKIRTLIIFRVWWNRFSVISIVSIASCAVPEALWLTFEKQLRIFPQKIHILILLKLKLILLAQILVKSSLFHLTYE